MKYYSKTNRVQMANTYPSSQFEIQLREIATLGKGWFINDLTGEPSGIPLPKAIFIAVRLLMDELSKTHKILNPTLGLSRDQPSLEVIWSLRSTVVSISAETITVHFVKFPDSITKDYPMSIAGIRDVAKSIGPRVTV